MVVCPLSTVVEHPPKEVSSPPQNCTGPYQYGIVPLTNNSIGGTKGDKDDDNKCNKDSKETDGLKHNNSPLLRRENFTEVYRDAICAKVVINGCLVVSRQVRKLVGQRGTRDINGIGVRERRRLEEVHVVVG